MFTRSRFLFAVVVGGLAAATPAPAQFGPGVRYNYQFGLSPALPYNPWLPSLPMAPGRYSYSGYTLSGWGASGPYEISYGYYRNGAAYISGGSPYAGGYYGGVGSGPGWAAGEGSAVAARQRAAVASAQRSAAYDVAPKGGATADLDRVLRDPAAARRDGPAPAIDAALVRPPEEAILSGEVLGRLAALIADLEAKGKKTESGLCPPELMLKVVFDGGPAADAANQFRTVELAFPSALAGAEHTDLRAGLEQAYRPVATAAHAGKKVAPADADKLLAEVAKAREGVAPRVKEWSVDDARAVSRFFARLESAAKFVKDPNAAGVAGAKWSQFGATVADLSKHLTKYKLRFGPPAAGDEDAYHSLHRGLLAYYAGLLQAK